MDNEILKFTKAIRNFEEAELSLGTLSTLKKIDDFSIMLINKINELQGKLNSIYEKSKRNIINPNIVKPVNYNGE